MSLFGTSPDRPSKIQDKSIFGDDVTPANTSSSSLFAEQNGPNSPWSMPTPKRNARQNLVKSLLPGNNVPDFYIDAYDTTLSSGNSNENGITVGAVRSILSSSNISTNDQTKIFDLVVPGGAGSTSGVGRNEFNVLLALIGIAQEGDDLTLDSVDERRRDLPLPKVDYIKNLQSKARAEALAQEQAQAQARKQDEDSRPATPSKTQRSVPQSVRPSQKSREDSLNDDPTNDPWASPVVTTDPPPSTVAHTLPANTSPEAFSSHVNGYKKSTGGFTAQADSASDAKDTQSKGSAVGGGSGGGGGGESNAWTTYNGNNSGGFQDQSSLGGGYGGGGNDDRSQRPGPTSQPSMHNSMIIPAGDTELVTVTMLPDKEGVFLFQHRNYEVKTIRRGSSVVRRYSDFIWLLDCLQKRYPFRRLPLLPPKRVQVNGNHLAADSSSFLEKRRKGLVRFANALVQHPILSTETLVVMFLTVPTELSVWRKQAQISVQEEFTGRSLPSDLEESLPSALSDLFDQVRIGVRKSSEVYINLCALLERMARRSEGLAADYLRFSTALQTLTEYSAETYAADANDVPLLDEGISATAKHLAESQTLLEDEARAWDNGVLEDLKSVRDQMVSMRDVFDRRDKYARDNISQLERRIQSSETKLQKLRNKPAEQVKAGEMEKVESSIIADKEAIVAQHARQVLIKECIRDEIVTFQSTIYTISRLHQDWSQERVKYAELQANNWRTLAEQLESMPLGES